ncbi:MAG: IS66-like element accessory protein TnpA [Ignavibacteria bacterium]
MTKPIEVITSVQRRRRWWRAEKERIVAAAIEPGAVASEVARAAGIHTSQLFRWRQELCRSSRSPENTPAFSAVTIAAAPAEPAVPIPALPPPAASSVVEIEFASGARMRIAGAVDPSMASAMIAALTTTKRRRRR